MPDPAGTKTDGPIVFGSQQVTIATVAFVAEDIDIRDGSREIDAHNEFGVPSKQALVATKLRGTLTLQCPSATVAPPAKFATVPITPIGGGSALNFLILEVGQRFTHMGETKIPITVVQKLN